MSRQMLGFCLNNVSLIAPMSLILKFLEIPVIYDL